MQNRLGQNIRHLRRANHWTQEQVSERLGYKSFTTVQSWESGRTIPPAKTVSKLAEIFKVSMDELVHLDLYLQSPIAFRQANYRTDGIRIPVLGRVPAGVPLEAIEDIIDYEDLSAKYYNIEKQYFAVLVRGDSMAPRYEDGDIVIVEVREDCNSGEDCVVMVNQHDATLKRVYKYENGNLELRPLNPAFDRIIYAEQEVEDLPIQILGIVREIRRRV